MDYTQFWNSIDYSRVNRILQASTDYPNLRNTDKVETIRGLGLSQTPVNYADYWKHEDELIKTTKDFLDSSSTDPNEYGTKVALASFLSNTTGVDYNTTLQMSVGGGLYKAANRQSEKGTALNAFGHNFAAAHYMGLVGENYTKYIATGNQEYKKMADNMYERAQSHRVSDDYNFFGKLLAKSGSTLGSSVGGSVKTFVGSLAVNFLTAGVGGALLKAGQWAVRALGALDAGSKQAGADLYELSRMADASGQTLDLKDPNTQRLFWLNVALTGAVEVGVRELMPGYKKLLNALSPVSVRDFVQQSLGKTIKDFGIDYIKSLGGEAWEEFAQGFISDSLMNAIKERQKEMGREGDLFEGKPITAIVNDASKAFIEAIEGMVYYGAVGTALGFGVNSIRNNAVNKHQQVKSSTGAKTGILTRNFISHENKTANKKLAEAQQKVDEAGKPKVEEETQSVKSPKEIKADAEKKLEKTKEKVGEPTEKQPVVKVYPTEQGIYVADEESRKALDALDEIHDGESDYDLRFEVLNLDDLDEVNSSNMREFIMSVADTLGARTVTGYSGNTIVLKDAKTLKEASTLIHNWVDELQENEDGTVTVYTKDNFGMAGKLKLVTKEQTQADNLETKAWTNKEKLEQKINGIIRGDGNPSQQDYLNAVEVNDNIRLIRERIKGNSEIEISDEAVYGAAAMLPALSKVTGKTSEELINDDLLFVATTPEKIQSSVRKQVETSAQDKGLVQGSEEYDKFIKEETNRLSQGTANVQTIEKDGKRIHKIQVSDKATANSLLHEITHVIRKMATAEQLSGFAKAYGIADVTDDNLWLEDSNEGLGRNFEERFVEDFRNYLASRKAPNEEVKGFFNNLKDFILRFIRLYRDTLNKDTVDAFDKLLGTKPNNIQTSIDAELLTDTEEVFNENALVEEDEEIKEILQESSNEGQELGREMTEGEQKQGILSSKGIDIEKWNNLFGNISEDSIDWELMKSAKGFSYDTKILDKMSNMVHLSVEATPSTNLGFWDDFPKLSSDAQRLFQKDCISILTDKDHSIYAVARKIGLKPVGVTFTDGYWEGGSNPSFRLEFDVEPVITTDENGNILSQTISEEDEQKLSLMAAILGRLLMQDAVGINQRFYTSSKANANAVFVSWKDKQGNSSALSEEEFALFRQCWNEALEEQEDKEELENGWLGFDATPIGLSIVSFNHDAFIPKERIEQLTHVALSKMSYYSELENKAKQGYILDAGLYQHWDRYIGGNWNENGNSVNEAYKQWAFTEESSAIFDGCIDFYAPLLRELRKQYSRRYNISEAVEAPYFEDSPKDSEQQRKRELIQEIFNNTDLNDSDDLFEQHVEYEQLIKHKKESEIHLISPRLNTKTERTNKNNPLTIHGINTLLKEKSDVKQKVLDFLNGKIKVKVNKTEVEIEAPIPIKQRKNESQDRYLWRIVDWMSKNTEALFDRTPIENRQFATEWYAQAHAVAWELKNKYNLSIAQTSAILAVFSPEMEWDNNIQLAVRCIDYYFNSIGEVASEAQLAWIRYIDPKDSKKWSKEKLEKTIIEREEKAKSLEGVPYGPEMPFDLAKLFLQSKMGVDLKATNPNRVAPEGQKVFLAGQGFIDQPLKVKQVKYTKSKGYRFKDSRTYSQMGKSTGTAIGKAIRFLRASETEIDKILDEYVSAEPKVRSFYNCILAPWSRMEDYVVDTHDMRGKFLSPIEKGMRDGIFSGVSFGNSGIPALLIEAGRLATYRINQKYGTHYLPQQIQSLTWLANQQLFGDKEVIVGYVGEGEYERFEFDEKDPAYELYVEAAKTQRIPIVKTVKYTEAEKKELYDLQKKYINKPEELIDATFEWLEKKDRTIPTIEQQEVKETFSLLHFPKNHEVTDTERARGEYVANSLNKHLKVASELTQAIGSNKANKCSLDLLTGVARSAFEELQGDLVIEQQYSKGKGIVGGSFLFSKTLSDLVNLEPVKMGKVNKLAEKGIGRYDAFVVFKDALVYYSQAEGQGKDNTYSLKDVDAIILSKDIKADVKQNLESAGVTIKYIEEASYQNFMKKAASITTEEDGVLADKTMLQEMSEERRIEAKEGYRKLIQKKVQEGQYIDRGILENFRGEDWVEDELQFRQWSKENPRIINMAVKHDSLEEFIKAIEEEERDKELIKISSQDNTWLEKAYNYAHKETVREKDLRFIDEYLNTDDGIREIANYVQLAKEGLWKGSVNAKNLRGIDPRVAKLSNRHRAKGIAEARKSIMDNPKAYRRIMESVMGTSDVNEEFQETYQESLLSDMSEGRNGYEHLKSSSLDLQIESLDDAIQNFADGKLDSEDEVRKAIEEITQTIELTEKRSLEARSELRNVYRKLADARQGVNRELTKQYNKRLEEFANKIEREEKRLEIEVSRLEQELKETKGKARTDLKAQRDTLVSISEQQISALKKSYEDLLAEKEAVIKGHEGALKKKNRLVGTQETKIKNLTKELDKKRGKYKALRKTLAIAEREKRRLEKQLTRLQRRMMLSEEKRKRQAIAKKIKDVCKKFDYDKYDAVYDTSFAWVYRNLFSEVDSIGELNKKQEAINEEIEKLSANSEENETLIAELNKQLINIENEIEAGMTQEPPVFAKQFFKTQFKQAKDMSLEELELFYQKLNQMKKIAREMLNRKVSARKEQLHRIAFDYAEQLIESNTVDKETKEKLVKELEKMGADAQDSVDLGGLREFVNTFIEKYDAPSELADTMNALLYKTGKMARIAVKIDGDKEGVVFDKFVKEAWFNQSKYLSGTNARTEAIGAKMHELGIKISQLQKKGYRYEVNEEAKKFHRTKELPVRDDFITLTRGEMIGVYVYKQNSLGYEKLVHAKGNGLTNKHVEEIVSQLTDQERAWGDAMIEAMKGKYAEISKVYYEVYNRKLGSRENYFPLVSKGKVVSGGTDILAADSSSILTYIDKGFTKQVNPRALYPLNLDVSSQINKQIRRQENFLAFAAWVRDCNALMDTSGLGDIIERRWGKNAKHECREYVRSLANPKRAEDCVDRGLGMILGRYVQAVLVGNLSSVLKQTAAASAVFRSQSSVGNILKAFFAKNGSWKAFLQANEELAFESLDEKSAKEFIYLSAPEIKNRRVQDDFVSFTSDMNQKAIRRAITKGGDWVVQHTMQAVDSAICERLWLASFYSNYEKLKEESIKTHKEFSSDEAQRCYDEARFIASRLIADTQNTNTVMEENGLQRKAKENAFFRTTMMFTNQAMNLINDHLFTVPRYWRTKNIKQLIGTIASLVVSTGIIGLVSGVYFKRDDEDDEEYVKRLIRDVGVSYLGTVAPFVSDFASQVFLGYDTNLINIGETLNKVVRTMEAETKSTEEKWRTASALLLEAFLGYEGLPTTAGKRIIQAATTGDWWNVLGYNWVKAFGDEQ